MKKEEVSREERRRQARIAADKKYGDVLPLQILEKMRVMAETQGWVRIRKSGSATRNKEMAPQERIGADVYVPVPGQDVGSGARKSYLDPKPLGMLVERTLKEKAWQEKIDVAAIAENWEAIVGRVVAANSCVQEYSEEKVLTIRARTVSWETQLRALSLELDKRISSQLGEGVVKEIRIVGPHRPSWRHGKYVVPGRGVRDTYD